ncbi:hypothetical protein DQ239_15740 [Blastococcus sp. TF02-09]|uniref:hypothetical protein n=1 Tax=unclassified Blastococcus TaxID=2619396 RepID=UPI000DE9A251|nr:MULTISPECIES: hypothetical protein [unclassified Blastococcus]RBY75958.1 hypothetical protein DQ239_15740 [Blastococcus sp. TF02-9]RBY88609.1 hypothetical protein DQ240_04175 [Blastococcus sp. TF02A-26]
MTTSSPPGAAEQALLTEYETYDQHVDVVSALEWLFTDPAVKGMPATVSHFERFPRIPVAGKRDPLTPDFTVLFSDGSAVIGEIAKLALHENSLDKVCAQIGGYAVLDRVPDGRGGLAAVSHLDVMLLVEAQVGLPAIRRVIKERYLDPEHPYKPPRPPCIGQFFRTESVYTLQRLPDPDNGVLYSGQREPHIGARLDEGLNIKASHFVATKAHRAFINDPIKPLYLATHLWTRTWPTQFGGGREDITVEEKATTTLLQKQYGVGGITVVRRALELLERAGLAANQGDGTWIVSRKLLGRSGERDVHKIIARRATTKPTRLVPRRPAPKSAASQDTLF